MNSLSCARDGLENATQDLFRLSGGNSIPVSLSPDASVVPPADVQIREATSAGPARASQASMLFSLEELMKIRASMPVSTTEAKTAGSQKLWDLQAGTPLFGTANDQALLTTPFKASKSPDAMSSMSVARRPSPAGRSRTFALLVGGGVVLMALSLLALFLGPAWLDADSPATAGPTVAPLPALDATRLATRAPAAPSGTGVQSERAVSPGTPDSVPAATPVTPKPAAVPAPEAAPVKAVASVRRSPVSRPTLPRKPQPKPKPKPNSAPGFSKAQAKKALGVAAGRSAGCNRGHAGKGKVQLTFLPSGRVSSAGIVSGALAGTPTGSCVLAHFRSARVPSFAGKSVTVAKSFRVP